MKRRLSMKQRAKATEYNADFSVLCFNNKTRVRVEPRSWDQGRRKNYAFILSAIFEQPFKGVFLPIKAVRKKNQQ